MCLVIPCHSLLHQTMSALRYGTRLACVIFSQVYMRLERERELKTLVSVIPGGIAGMIRIFPGHL